jgi:hypothetical protein
MKGATARAMPYHTVEPTALEKSRHRSLAHGRRATLAEVGLLGLGLGDALGEHGGVFVLQWAWLVAGQGGGRGRGTYGGVLGLLGVAALEGQAVALVLEALGGDQALDLGRLGVRLLALALGLDLAADDELADLEHGGSALRRSG